MEYPHQTRDRDAGPWRKPCPAWLSCDRSHDDCPRLAPRGSWSLPRLAPRGLLRLCPRLAPRGSFAVPLCCPPVVVEEDGSSSTNMKKCTPGRGGSGCEAQARACTRHASLFELEEREALHLSQLRCLSNLCCLERLVQAPGAAQGYAEAGAVQLRSPLSLASEAPTGVATCCRLR